jgi:hypothetical protein
LERQPEIAVPIRSLLRIRSSAFGWTGRQAGRQADIHTDRQTVSQTIALLRRDHARVPVVGNKRRIGGDEQRRLYLSFAPAMTRLPCRPVALRTGSIYPLHW